MDTFDEHPNPQSIHHGAPGHDTVARRRLFALGAAALTAAGSGAVFASSASAAPSQTSELRSGQAPSGPYIVRRSQETTYDFEKRRQNPANQLGCPLGRGY